MQKSEDNTEKISKTLEKLILQKRIESIPKREVFIGDKQEITKHKDVYFSDASLLNKYRIPINPTKGLKPKIINWVKRKLYTVVKQVTEILVSTQERFNHETISNFSLVNQKIDKINNNNENHIQELLKQNQKLAEALKVIIKSNETNKNNIIAKIDNLKEHIELEIKDVKEHIELEIKDVKEHIELEIKDVKEQINPEIDINYLAFEDTFRQLEDNSQSKQSDYMEFFKGQSNILDIGCGRGEFLETLKYYNIDAKGIDSNDQMISICKNKGLEVEKEDALEFLSKQ
ncbi:methionine biosynthesis protein MetW, partial [Patescibacteria group bacterium]|nr:methionine biosynthesis protein MetW [Patescibacteria group bacterium]